jgi:two-component system, chemotaxis family, chemotaxis protein CheY
VNLLILVVDDEPDVEQLFRQQFRRDLRTGRFAMEFAQSAPAALERIAATKERSLILILSDINMPGMSGLELLGHIKQKYLKPPPIVMMITAYGDADNYNAAKGLGADDFLTKPVDFVMLKNKLKILN